MDTEPASDLRATEFVTDPAEQMRRAEALEREGQFEEALSILRDETIRYPQNPQPWLELSRLLVSLKRGDEAEQVLADALEHLPDVTAVFSKHAELAEARQDWSEADRRWAEVRMRFPRYSAGWLGGMRSLRELGELDAADKLIAASLDVIPRDMGLAFAWADVPRLRGDTLARLERWADIRTKHPDIPGAFSAGALALRDAGQMAEAEAVARDGCARFPNDHSVQRALGIVLVNYEKFEAADEVLQRAVMLAPSDATSHYYYASAAIGRGAKEAAVERIVEGKERFPHDTRFDVLMDSASKIAEPETPKIEFTPDVEPPRPPEPVIRRPAVVEQRPGLFSRLWRPKRP